MMRKKNTVAIANIRRNIVDMWENKQNHDFHHFVNQNKKSMTNWPNKRIWWKSLPNRIQITTTIFKRENFFLYKYKLLQFFSPLFLAHIFLSTIYFPRCFWHNILHSHNELTGDGVKHTVLHIQNSPRSSIYINNGCSCRTHNRCETQHIGHLVSAIYQPCCTQGFLLSDKKCSAT